MSIKHFFANMQIAEKFAVGRSSVIQQNVRLGEIFPSIKKSYIVFFLSLKGPTSTLCPPVRNVINRSNSLIC